MLDDFFHLIWSLPGHIWQRVQRKGRGCYRLLWGCLGLALLLLALGCGLLFWAAQRAAAAPPSPPESLSIFLLIDNSNSMFEKEGVGSDPDLLRIDAARLFISYLGVDNVKATHTCGVIFFGSQAELVVPLTHLGENERRRELLEEIATPQRMGWTDQAAAISLALAQFDATAASERQALVLLTDGKPEWGYEPTAAEQSTYIAGLRQLGNELAARELPLFIILLAGEATDADPEIEQVWTPIWQELTATTAPGRFYEVRHAEELAGVYHDIVVALAGSQTAGPVLQSDVGPAGLRQTISVEPDLERLTLVVSKSRPEVVVTVLQPDGTPLAVGMLGVRHAGQPGASREEVWAVDAPAAGEWLVLVSGEGRVTIWKDYRLAPATPAALPTASPTATPAVSSTATSTPTRTATPSATPAPAATGTPAQTLPMPPSAQEKTEPTTGPTYWPWLVGLLLVVAAVAGGSYRRRQRRRPVLTGTLKVLAGPAFGLDQREVELDLLRRRKLRVGAEPADVTLPGTDQALTMRLGNRLGDIDQVIVSGTEGVLLNDRPLQGEQPIQDADVIAIGNIRLRYENLRLRRAREATRLLVSNF